MHSTYACVPHSTKIWHNIILPVSQPGSAQVDFERQPSWIPSPTTYMCIQTQGQTSFGVSLKKKKMIPQYRTSITQSSADVTSNVMNFTNTGWNGEYCKRRNFRRWKISYFSVQTFRMEFNFILSERWKKQNQEETIESLQARGKKS